jgi:hypothetical protein
MQDKTDPTSDAAVASLAASSWNGRCLAHLSRVLVAALN